MEHEQKSVVSKKTKPQKILIPRITIATVTEDNYVNLFRDTKPLVAFYYQSNCTFCEEVKKFFSEYICPQHLKQLNENKENFEACKEDRLFPLFIKPNSNTAKHHSVIYRLPSNNGKNYNELILLDGEEKFKSKTALIRKLKGSLHLLPSENKWIEQPHQSHFSDWYKEEGHREDSINCCWTTGSGKTLGILNALFKNRHLFPPEVTTIKILTTNTLIDYWNANINTSPCFNSDQNIMCPLKIEIIGYAQFEKLCSLHFTKTQQGAKKKNPTGLFLQDSILVIDEAQYYRNLTPAMKQVAFTAQFSYQTILASATLFLNDPEDSLGAIALLKGPRKANEGKTYPWKTMADLENDINKWRVSILDRKETKLITETFEHRSHFFDPKVHDKKNWLKLYPEVKHFVHYVKMSLPQTFSYLINQKKSLKIGHLTFVSSVSNAYNTITKSHCNFCPIKKIFVPKYQELKQNIKAIGGFPQVIHSRFLEKGVTSMLDDLKKEYPKIALISGNTATSQRDLIRDKYNIGKLDLLCISNVGSVGLDLHNTKALHLYEEAENLKTEEQTFSRVIRLNSHKNSSDLLAIGHRPQVQIHKYVSIFPDFKQDSFDLKEIQDCEKIFEEHYGKDLKLTKTKTSKLTFYGLNDDSKISIGDVLEQLKSQTSEVTIEQHMLKDNVRKQNEIDPLYDAMIRASKQLIVS